MKIELMCNANISNVILSFVLVGCLVGFVGPAAGETQPAGVSVLDYRVERSVLVQEANSEFCWFHPRVAAMPGWGRNGMPAAVLTLQKHLVADDHYSGLYFMRSDDYGRTWRGPVEVRELAWGREPGGVTVSVCDVTPGWHAPSGRVLAVGAQVRYDAKGNHLRSKPRSIQTAYAAYDPKADRWSAWRVLQLPADAMFDYAVSACAQWLTEPDGRILLPLYYKIPPGRPGKGWAATVARCTFDGNLLSYRQHGDELVRDKADGFTEPSLVRFGGCYYLTLRGEADTNGYVTTSEDGLHYKPIKPWTFDDGAELGSVNTQQHWLAHSEGLFLCYTRRGAHNDHIARNRAPLFVAQVDPARLCVLRQTEKVLIPERGLMLGNFGAAMIDERESWVTDAEFISYRFNAKPTAQGGNGSVFLARVVWSKPNRMGVTTAPER